MAFTNIIDGNNISKSLGDKVSIVDVDSILALSAIANDPDFDSTNKWRIVVVLYTHVSGQKKIIIHRYRNGQWQGVLKVNGFMNSGIWQKQKIAIFDNSNDYVVIERSDMIPANEDINVI